MPVSKTVTKSKGSSTKKTATRAKKAKFYHKPNCTTCVKARKYLEKRGFQLYFRDLAKERMSAAEIEKLIGKRDYKEFLNTRNEVYRENDMKENPPSRREAISMMSKEPNLIRRPVVVAGGRVVVGFDEDGMAHL
jgi:arsenate reductase